MERTLRNLVIVLGDQLAGEALQVRNVDRIDGDERVSIGQRAAAIRRGEVVSNA